MQHLPFSQSSQSLSQSGPIQSSHSCPRQQLAPVHSQSQSSPSHSHEQSAPAQHMSSSGPALMQSLSQSGPEHSLHDGPVQHSENALHFLHVGSFQSTQSLSQSGPSHWVHSLPMQQSGPSHLQSSTPLMLVQLQSPPVQHTALGSSVHFLSQPAPWHSQPESQSSSAPGIQHCGLEVLVGQEPSARHFGPQHLLSVTSSQLLGTSA
mmetsp:Transcript_21911/g.33446  ORF Transcript_21911/g.33446 Transcript_21911/m.33446 type:complete len:207 (+) Transcript_21911:4233-4853(+)